MAAARVRVAWARLGQRLGLRPDSFLVLIALLIGLLAAAAAVSFHELILVVRHALYERIGAPRLYGPWMLMLIAWPALGGLTVGVISRYVLRARESHGVVDVMESVIRSSGFMRPAAAIEKILTSGITIGTGGSCGAEGPIVQIGAAIASGMGRLFGLTRAQMPVIIGCGAAAGISAIFNSPMGGLLFALEVILQDFSIRNVTPVVVASVIANVTTRAIFANLLGESWVSIFAIPDVNFTPNWLAVGNFAILGALAGGLGVTVTRLMYFTEERFARLPIPAALKPALGGALLGVLGVAYVLFFGRLILGQSKPIPFNIYPMPAFFGDGYGVIQLFLTARFYDSANLPFLASLLAFLIVAKLAGTCLTLGSGGSGGVIAPSLFLGAAMGGLLGVAFNQIGTIDPANRVHPQVYALVGMGAVLAAVVHAPLASILILLELTRDSSLVLPAMLASVVATGVARIVLPDSIYTLALRRRGVQVLGAGDTSLLHRLSVEQVDLDPATVLRLDDPFQRILDLMTSGNSSGGHDFAVADARGAYCGMVVEEDIRTALLAREAIPLLLVKEIVRRDLPMVSTSDDLARTMDAFSRHDVGHLAVGLPGTPGRVIGLISRSALMRRYQKALAGTT